MPRVQVIGKISSDKICKVMPESLAEVLKEPLGKLEEISLFDEALCEEFQDEGDADRVLQKIREALHFCEEVTIRVGNACVDRVNLKKSEKSLADLNFSPRVMNCLEQDGIDTIEKLVGMRARDLLGVRNLGDVSLCEIRQTLEKAGLKLKGD